MGQAGLAPKQWALGLDENQATFGLKIDLYHGASAKEEDLTRFFLCSNGRILTKIPSHFKFIRTFMNSTR
jgi:hypothetical protein